MYTIPFGLLREAIPRINGSNINIYDIDSYTNTLEKLITKMFTEAPKTVVYLLMSNDDKGNTVVSRLSENLKRIGITMERLGTVIGEAPGALGRGNSREIMILKLVKLS
jgi:hypothetical protein